jgi:hypothetical protein
MHQYLDAIPEEAIVRNRGVFGGLGHWSVDPIASTILLL